MDQLTGYDRALQDPQHLAATARSILSCPAEVDLLVDGVATVLDGDEVLGPQDHHGSPTFSCRPGSELATSAGLGRSALLTISSGLGPADGTERENTLVLAGRLELRGTQECECCGETRAVVALDLNFVLIIRAGDAEHSDQQFRVPLEGFRSPAHHLNRGYLQRSVEHANDHHQGDLRRAVSLSAGTRVADIVGVRLSGLSTRGVELAWVDTEGAHRRLVDFPRPARSTAELGEMMRRELSAGLC